MVETPTTTAQAALAGDSFAPNYCDARRAFLETAGQACAQVWSVTHPRRGLQDETLAMDFAWLGPRLASRVLVSLSATHGVEGLYGSGCQVGFLRQQGRAALPPDTAVLLVHGVNPFGFSWLRRVDADNIDVNRNCIDWQQSLPENADYALVHPMLLPAQWSPDSILRLRLQVVELMAKWGARRATRAITGGQYVHPEGLFFGGMGPCWSSTTLAEQARLCLNQASVIAVLDHHTGLGPEGHTEIICRHLPGSQALTLARQWWGDDVTSPVEGQSQSQVIDGNVRVALEQWCAQALVVSAALEVGTQPSEQVMLALVADNWLHQRGEPESAVGDAIRAQVRDAFFIDTPVWRDRAFTRAMHLYDRTLAGLQGVDTSVTRP
jgi:hypothetical protein